MNTEQEFIDQVVNNHINIIEGILELLDEEQKVIK